MKDFLTAVIGRHLFILSYYVDCLIFIVGGGGISEKRAYDNGCGQPLVLPKYIKKEVGTWKNIDKSKYKVGGPAISIKP